MDYRINLSPPEMGQEERRLLAAAFDAQGAGPSGSQVESFEGEFISYLGGDVHAVAMSSGTAALQVALLVAGVREGHEVLCPTLASIATANAISYVGARPIFIDSEPHTWTVDPSLAVEELETAASRGDQPAAVITVDLYGRCADHRPIVDAAHDLGIPVVEDAAEAVGATYQGRPAGTLGDVGVFSFASEHIITTSTGGMLVTSNADWARRARTLAAGRPSPEQIGGGLDYEMSDLLAAVGRAQLQELDAKVSRCRTIHELYRERLAELPGVTFQEEGPQSRSSRWLTCITVDPAVAGADRDELRDALEGNGVEARPLWKPLHRQPSYEECRTVGGQEASSIFDRGLALPSGTGLTAEQIDEIASIIARAVSSE